MTYSVVNPRFNALVRLIYQAAFEPELWETCLDETLSLLEVSLGSLTFIDLDRGDFHIRKLLFKGMDAQAQQSFLEKYRYMDPFSQMILVKQEGESGRGTELISIEELTATKYYREWMQPMGLLHTAAGIIAKDAESMALLSFAARGQEPVTDTQLETVRALLPHYTAAFKMHRRVGDMLALNEAFTDSLERIPYGVLLMTEKDEVLFQNQHAARIVEEGDGLSLGRQGLVATDSEDHRGLKRMLRHAMPTRPFLQAREEKMSSVPPVGDMLRVSRPSGLRPYEIMALPLASKELTHGFTMPLVLVLLTDPEAEQTSQEETLQRLYGLTYAEAEVALLLMQGHAPNSIAGELGIAISTVRTHMRGVFTKTDTTRQADLVRLLLSGLASVRTQL